MNIGPIFFVRPLWLLGLLAVIALLIWVWRARSSSGAWAKVCDAHLLQFLSLGKEQSAQRRWPTMVLGLGLSLAIVAGAGPAWERQQTPIFRSADALVVVLDLSVSMLAQDIKPSRLERARFEVIDLLDARQEGQTALVVYASEPFTVSPLTDDTRTIISQMNALSPDIMPSGGSRLDRAMSHAAELLNQAMMPNGRIVIVTDSAEPRDSVRARELVEQGAEISVLAIGTEQGAPISLPDGGFVKDRAGNIVVPGLAIAPLRSVAEAGGGQFVVARNDTSDVGRFVEPRGPLDTRDEQARQSTGAEQWKELGPFIILGLLPLALLAFRRGFLLVILLLPLVPSAEAASLESLWRRPDQQAARALDEGRPQDAIALADDPWQLGTAQYQVGDYHGAAQTFSKLDTADGHYNRANALALLGDTDAAIAAYETALSKDPDHEDAAYNKQVLEQMKQQQEQQEQEQNNDESEEQGEQEEQQPSDQQEQSDSSQSEEGDESEPEPEQNEQEQAADEQDAAEEEQPLEAEEFDQEQRQAVEQWLRRIPDDPGGLLRRKFMLQYQQRARPQEAEENDW